jgi:hypothetical protein
MSVSFSGYRDGNGGLIQALRVGASTRTATLTIAATATTITVTAPVVRVVADVACYLVWGNGAATLAAVGDMLMPANVVEYHVVDKNKNVSALSTATTGTVYITEVV